MEYISSVKIANLTRVSQCLKRLIIPKFRDQIIQFIYLSCPFFRYLYFRQKLYIFQSPHSLLISISPLLPFLVPGRPASADLLCGLSWVAKNCSWRSNLTHFVYTTLPAGCTKWQRMLACTYVRKKSRRAAENIDINTIKLICSNDGVYIKAGRTE